MHSLYMHINTCILPFPPERETREKYWERPEISGPYRGRNTPGDNKLRGNWTLTQDLRQTYNAIRCASTHDFIRFKNRMIS